MQEQPSCTLADRSSYGAYSPYLPEYVRVRYLVRVLVQSIRRKFQPGKMGVYPWIITRRYAIANESERRDDVNREEPARKTGNNKIWDGRSKAGV